MVESITRCSANPSLGDLAEVPARTPLKNVENFFSTFTFPDMSVNAASSMLGPETLMFVSSSVQRDLLMIALTARQTGCDEILVQVSRWMAFFDEHRSDARAVKVMAEWIKPFRIEGVTPQVYSRFFSQDIAQIATNFDKLLARFYFVAPSVTDGRVTEIQRLIRTVQLLPDYIQMNLDYSVAYLREVALRAQAAAQPVVSSMVSAARSALPQSEGAAPGAVATVEAAAGSGMGVVATRLALRAFRRAVLLLAAGGLVIWYFGSRETSPPRELNRVGNN